MPIVNFYYYFQFDKFGWSLQNMVFNYSFELNDVLFIKLSIFHITPHVSI